MDIEGNQEPDCQEKESRTDDNHDQSVELPPPLGVFIVAARCVRIEAHFLRWIEETLKIGLDNMRQGR